MKEYKREERKKIWMGGKGERGGGKGYIFLLWICMVFCGVFFLSGETHNTSTCLVRSGSAARFVLRTAKCVQNDLFLLPPS